MLPHLQKPHGVPAERIDTIRARCIRLLGPNLREFQRSRQPDFQDRTGEEILASSPGELLASLKHRQREMENATPEDYNQ
jgi:hypothetical protein